jgi:4-amino-4-deoxychorismate mutase
MTENLRQLRNELDQLDERILDTLSRRMAICRQVAMHKAEVGIPIMQEARVAHVKAKATDGARTLGLSEAFVEAIYELVIEESCRVQHETIDSAKARAHA